ncbi:hypothetical protein SAMN05216226_10380 [Halovenus aranensis]|uniref:IclR helix-turn-helix domain-containing protein n=1 Tax=Halovenus aranensis TaxID=890420 RepID=A0A1G8THX7_9EURY|nr:hypothetical protein [Halovenus aranensis]SDJ41149.1 hypothetical protein SAMN05216226_10380 [Halovenus aranensis]
MPEPSRDALRLVPALCLGTVVVVALCAFATGVGGASPSVYSPDSTAPPDSVQPPQPNVAVNTSIIETNTTFVVELQTDGSARWEVTERFNLSTQRQQQVFSDLAAEFESGSVEGRDLGFGAFERASELIDAETDRDVRIVNPQRVSRVGDDLGELTLSFTWENFARVKDNKLYLDDVFETEAGLWFQGLGPNQTLRIEAPEGLGFDDAEIIPDRGALRWQGPASFSNETLQAVIGLGTGGTETTPTVTPTATATPGGTGPATPGGSDGTLSVGQVALAFAVFGAVGVLFVGVMMAVGPERVREAVAELGTSETEPSQDATEESSVEESAPATAATQEVDLELLSDEERVERLLEENGGRMKQATIVKETGWSNAKVSQLLSSMDEEDRIDKLRIGRENLISFPDEDITDIGDK